MPELAEADIPAAFDTIEGEYVLRTLENFYFCDATGRPVGVETLDDPAPGGL